MQTSIFDVLYPKYKITKPILLIEMFGGYGSQYMALKRIGANVKHHKLIEWAAKSIQAYNDIHIQDYADYSKDLTDEEVLNKVYEMGVSLNYNEPATKEQLKRQNYRKIYNNIIATNNLVNIQNVKGEDLQMDNTDKYDYIWTYSFPCQDLSNAGKKAGFNDTSTRSGMLWEVERILEECDKLGTKPRILLMENVIQVHSFGENLENFQKWQLKLEELGYKNYMQDLIATDYGIPQTRNRCFMISILGDYNYTFPKPIPLKLKLKDMLEDNVDEKYYLSDKMIKCFSRETNDGKFPRGDRFKQALKLTNEKGLAGTITTAAGNRATDNFIKITKDTENYIEWEEKGKLDIDCRASKEDKVSTTICTTPKNKVLIHNKSLQETLEQNEIKNTCYIDTYNRRIEEEKSGTITTGVSFRNNTFLAIKNNTKKGYLEATDGDGIDLSMPNSKTRRGRVQKEAIQTLTTQNNLGVVNNLRIRKLTPRECFRLMGVKDEDFEKVKVNQSDSSLYHLAGDSIVVNVLMAIFKEMIN